MKCCPWRTKRQPRAGSRTVGRVVDRGSVSQSDWAVRSRLQRGRRSAWVVEDGSAGLAVVRSSSCLSFHLGIFELGPVGQTAGRVVLTVGPRSDGTGIGADCGRGTRGSRWMLTRVTLIRVLVHKYPRYLMT